MNNLEVKDFQFGIIDTIDDKSIPAGTASKGLNWLALVDKIELRRGYAILGNLTAGTGKITSKFVARMSNGTEIPYRTRGKKLEYYIASTETWTEVGTDLLGTAGDGHSVAYAVYSSLAGDQLFISSPYLGLIKIMLANPGSYSEMYDAAKNYKGYIKAKQNRIFLWGRLKDKTGLYLSYIDSQNSTDVADENVGTGDGSEKTHADTLAFKAGGAKRTCFGIEATDGTETFTDNYDGTLTGDKGGTGTINYTSGAISLTFNTAPTNTQAITCDYSWEDSTDGGLCDFTYSATRLAGEGDIIRQDDGGAIMNIFSYQDVEYCMHEHKTWALSLTADDTNATNFVYRDKVGIPSRLAGVSTGNGIYYLDVSDEKDPQVRLLTLSYTGEKIIPISVSKATKYKNKLVGIDLSSYSFDKAVMLEWGDFIVLACRVKESENDRLLVHDKIKKTMDWVDFWASDLAVYEGTLIAGDPFVPNSFTLFSGFDDDDSDIPNYREGANIVLSDGLSKVKKLAIEGEIATEQIIKVSASIDSGGFVEIGQIRGDGDYVDTGSTVSVGTHTIGSKEVGGGGGNGVQAYHYFRQFDFGQDKFHSVKLKFEAIGVGYASVSLYNYRDIRLKSHRLPSRYR